MHFTLETQGTNSFLTYCMEADEALDSMSMGMIENNHIKGIIPFHYLQLDDNRFLKYNISSQVSLAKYFSGVVNRRHLLSVMKGVASVVLNAAEYMLEPGSFVWDKDYIFVDAKTDEVYLICLPIESEGKNGNINLEQFFRQLLLSVQFDQTENCDYVARLLGFFNANAHFSLREFAGMLDSIEDGRGDSTYRNQAVSESGHRTPFQQAPQMTQPQQTSKSPQMSQSQQMSQPSQMPQTPASAESSMQTPLPEPEKKKEKKGFSLFGDRKKSEEKKAEKEKTEKAKQEKPRFGGPAGFGGMKIPGVDSVPPQSASAEQPAAGGQVLSGQQATSGGQTAVAQRSTADLQPKQTPYAASAYEVSANDDDRTEIAESEETEIADNGGAYAWLELISAVQPGAMPRIDLNFDRDFWVIGRISSDTKKPDIAFPEYFKRIGRQHARIERRGNEFYIVDLGSVNHTLLDGQILVPNQAYQLSEGMELTLTTGKMVQYRIHLG